MFSRTTLISSLIFQGACSNCFDLTQKYETAVKESKEKDKSIKDLKGLVTKFQTQLKQQEQLMKMVDNSRGINSSKLSFK